MKKEIFWTFIIVLLLIFSIILFGIILNKEVELEEYTITINRIDQSIRNEEGEILALIYYDKPIILNETEISIKINSFLGREYQEWSIGAGRLSDYDHKALDTFMRSFESMKEIYGEDVLKEQPLQYTVDTEVMYISREIISIRQTCFGFIGGPSSTYYYGSTFDLETGELLSFNYFVDVDADAFRESIASYLTERALEFGYDEKVKEIQQVYGPDKEHSYDAHYYNEQFKLNYEYYYDGEYIGLILNQGIVLWNGNCIMRWNGKVGDDFNAAFIGYIKQEDGLFKMIEF